MLTVLKKKRLTKGLRNMDVARKIGISETAYSKIENLTLKPNRIITKKLERLFKTTAEELFQMEE